MNNCSQVEALTLWNIWEFLIILFESFLFFLFMNRKLDSKKRIFKWQWCAWLLFSIILFKRNHKVIFDYLFKSSYMPV